MTPYDLQTIRDGAALLQAIASGQPMTAVLRARCARVAGYLDEVSDKQDALRGVARLLPELESGR
jgi:hypothetical protein